MLERLKEVKAHYPTLDILEINHDQDRIHMLVVISPKMSVSQVVRVLKTNTSRDLKKKFSFLKNVYSGGQTAFAQTDILCPLSELMNLLSRDTLKTKVKKIWGKRSLYSRRQRYHGCKPVECLQFLHFKKISFDTFVKNRKDQSK
jgi:hypothetical protein